MSAVAGLFTVKIAAEGNGHDAGAAPKNDGPTPAENGSQGQLCCGENEIVTEQLWPAASVKGVFSAGAQLSDSVKLGRPVKSLKVPNIVVSPD